MKKKKYVSFLLFIMLLVLTGCKVGPEDFDSCKKMISDARRKHGDCDVISQVDEKMYKEVVLMDKLQGFEYRVVQRVAGSTTAVFLKEYVLTDDEFNEGLYEYVNLNAGESLQKTCEKYGASYNFLYNPNRHVVIVPNSLSDEMIRDFVSELAVILQEYNLNGRMDSDEICLSLERKKSDYRGKLRGGYYILGDGEFITGEEQIVDKLLKKAHEYSFKKVKYVRHEIKKISESGCSEDKFVTYNQDYNGETMFCYFTTGDGQEYYICDFACDYGRLKIRNKILENEYYTNYVELNMDKYTKTVPY